MEPNFLGYSFLNKLKSEQDGQDLSDDIFKCIFFDENFGILIQIP